MSFDTGMHDWLVSQFFSFCAPSHRWHLATFWHHQDADVKANPFLCTTLEHQHPCIRRLCSVTVLLQQEKMANFAPSAPGYSLTVKRMSN